VYVITVGVLHRVSAVIGIACFAGVAADGR